MSRFVVVMLASASVTGLVSLASAQISPERYAAIEKCTRQALAQYPDTSGASSARQSVYEACMKAAGQPP
jgi:hypothetical protein